MAFFLRQLYRPGAEPLQVAPPTALGRYRDWGLGGRQGASRGTSGGISREVTKVIIAFAARGVVLAAEVVENGSLFDAITVHSV